MKLATLKQYISEKVRNSHKDIIPEINEMTEASHLQFREQLGELCILSKDLIRNILQNMNQKKQEVITFYIKSNPYKVKILEKALENAMKGNHDLNIPAALQEKLKRKPRFWTSQESESLNRFRLVEPPIVKIPNFKKEVSEQQDTQPQRHRNFTSRSNRNTATIDNMRITKQDIIHNMFRTTNLDKQQKSQVSSPRGRSQHTLRLFQKDMKSLKDKIKALKNKQKKTIGYSVSNPNLFFSSKDFKMKPWTSSAAREKIKPSTSAGSRSKQRRASRSQELNFDSRCLSP